MHRLAKPYSLPFCGDLEWNLLQAFSMEVGVGTAHTLGHAMKRCGEQL